MNFNRDDFSQRGKKKRSLVGTPKRSFDPISSSNQKLLNLSDIAKALETVAPLSIVFQAVPQPEIDFIREVISIQKHTTELVSVDDVILMSNNKQSFEENLLSNMSVKSIAEIEESTHGQKWVKMRKIKKDPSKCIDTWSLNQTISGMILTNPDLPALKYGHTMETEASNTFYELMKSKHSKLTVTECGLYLDVEIPYVGGSPDRIVNCLCCPPACLEIKCPYSINYMSPKDERVKLFKERYCWKLFLKQKTDIIHNVKFKWRLRELVHVTLREEIFCGRNFYGRNFCDLLPLKCYILRKKFLRLRAFS